MFNFDLKPTKIASIGIGVVLAILLIVLGFKIIQSVFTRAADIEPRDVVVSEITQSSAKLSWATGEDTQGVVEYGTSPTALNFFAPESQKTQAHDVDLTLLSPTTTYYFQIRIGDKKYDNGGVPWTFTTKSVQQPTQAPLPTRAPTAIQTQSPTPVQTIVIPSTCNETDCAKVKAKIGNGCSTRDYFLCINRLTATPAPTKP